MPKVINATKYNAAQWLVFSIPLNSTMFQSSWVKIYSCTFANEKRATSDEIVPRIVDDAANEEEREYPMQNEEEEGRKLKENYSVQLNYLKRFSGTNFLLKRYISVTKKNLIFFFLFFPIEIFAYFLLWGFLWMFEIISCTFYHLFFLVYSCIALRNG